KQTRNFYLELGHYRTLYKESLRDLEFWSVMGKKLIELLRIQDRSEDQDLLFERILILIRNILQIPDRNAYVHDEILWALHKAGVSDLLLFIASSDDQITYCLHVLEIISLMFKNQDAESICKASLEGKSEKLENAEALVEATKKEMIAKRSRNRPTRHSRFGGTYVINNVPSISGGNMIYHKAVQKSKDLTFDEEKRSKKKSLKFIGQISKGSGSSSSGSSMPVKVFLKEFSIEFLNTAYNVLMQTVRDLLNREKTQQNDDSYYLWALRFFMKFNRLNKFRPELVSETLNRGIFHYAHTRIDHYKEHMDHEKKNAPKFKIWAKRLHLGLISYQELLFNLVAMQNSSDGAVKRSGEVLTHSIFYESEYRELCLGLLFIYSPERMSLGYLKDLVETTHIYIKIIENMCKSKKLIIQSTKKKKKATKSAGKRNSKSVGEANPQSSGIFSIPRRIELWSDLSSEVAQLLIGSSEDILTKDLPVLYDPLSEDSMDTQRKKAICIIQKMLLDKNVRASIGVLRSARDIWPENDIFGDSDIDPEDEAIILKDILLTEIEGGLMDTAVNVVPEGDLEEGEEEGNEEEEEEEETGEIVQTSESELNFKDFMRDFVNKRVCVPYSVMFANFKSNSAYTNHCVLKMFHRIAFDHKLAAMLFHISIFDTFRHVFKEYDESLACQKENSGLGGNKTLKEMARFAKYVFREFTVAAAGNPKIFIELCFWKNVKEAIEVVEGYGTQGGGTEKAKASYWSEEDEETLIRVFQQTMAMENKPDDILDSITMFFHESAKSRRQVARKLKGLGLIQ
ncbi:Protein timeless -like protein, partial [Caligus rogercresseyi]